MLRSLENKEDRSICIKDCLVYCSKDGDIKVFENEINGIITEQYEEVQKVKWASKEEIFSMIESGEFIPYYQSFIQLFFDIRKQYGCHQRK